MENQALLDRERGKLASQAGHFGPPNGL